MEEKYWLQDEQKEEKFYQHRSHICDLFFYVEMRIIVRNIDSLKNNKDFQIVYNNKKSYANKYLIMYIAQNNDGRCRIGISVSKKVGNSIVRHRITRLIRESYRLNKEKFKNGFDIVVVARVTAKGQGYQNIESALLHLGKLHHIVYN